MTRFIDTHCHLDLLEKPMDQVLHEAGESGVDRLITISVDGSSLRKVKRLLSKWHQIYGTAGVHPHSASEFGKEGPESIRNAVQQETRIVAVGEIGLDYHYLHSPRDVQKLVFREQLKLAEELDMPVVLHTREAEEDTLKLLRECPPPRMGVAHSFTGSRKMAEELLDMGWYLGINGIISFKKADDLKQVVRHVPIQRILLETDAPYLSPVPYRGKPNAPNRIPVIAECLAGILEIPLENLASQTCLNAEELFGLLN